MFSIGCVDTLGNSPIWYWTSLNVLSVWMQHRQSTHNKLTDLIVSLMSRYIDCEARRKDISVSRRTRTIYSPSHQVRCINQTSRCRGVFGTHLAARSSCLAHLWNQDDAGKTKWPSDINIVLIKSFYSIKWKLSHAFNSDGIIIRKVQCVW